jgi:hypothetical protein
MIARQGERDGSRWMNLLEVMGLGGRCGGQKWGGTFDPEPQKAWVKQHSRD